MKIAKVSPFGTTSRTRPNPTRVHRTAAKEPLRLLLVEDSPADARSIRELLTESRSMRFELTDTVRLEDAVRALGASRFDAVLLDLNLPETAGLESVGRLNSVAPEVPIVVLSGTADEDLAVRAVQAGAQDFLVKGTADAELLTRSIRYALQRKIYERHIRHLADHDTLTQLPHGRLLRDRLRQAAAISRRHKRMAALLFVDLDLFKHVNDTLGHGAGDAVLIQVARRLKRCVRESDTVARIGGDEFALVVADIADVEDAARLAEKALAALQEPLRVRGHAVLITASIGISVFPQDGNDPDTLLRKADLAMYSAKRGGRDCHRFYVRSDGLQVPRRLALVGGLRHAVENNEIFLHYQPIIELRTGRVTTVEALARWRHPRLGLVPPDEFVPLAEESRVIADLGAWVLRQAGQQAKTWAATHFPQRRIAVNLSRMQLETGNLAVAVTNMLFETGLDPWLLELDLTAGSLADGSDAILEQIRDVRATGVRIHYDDFGVDPCSLRRIKQLPIDGVKIDRSLVAGCARDRGDLAVVGGVIAMAHGMALQVTAEGVEDAAQLAVLRDLGCDRAQGSYFSMPLPADELTLRLGARWH